MKTFWNRFYPWLALAGILLICFIGAAAALLGLRRLDAWCSRQITDTPVLDT
jgi:hypothetical protein